MPYRVTLALAQGIGDEREDRMKAIRALLEQKGVMRVVDLGGLIP